MDIIEAYLKLKKKIETENVETQSTTQDNKYYRPRNFDEFLLEKLKQEGATRQNRYVTSRQEWLNNRNRNEE